MRKRKIDYGDDLRKLLTELLKLYRQSYLHGPYARRSGGTKPVKYYREHNFRYQPEPKYQPKYQPRDNQPRVIEKEMYIPKERLVYDPEVKKLLEEIRDRLEPDEQEILEKLESSPELLERLSEIYRQVEPQPGEESVERAEVNEIEDRRENGAEVEEYSSENLGESYADAEINDAEINYEFGGVEDGESAEVESFDVEIEGEGGVDGEAFEIETKADLADDIVESGEVNALESLDLSELEAELYDYDIGFDVDLAEAGDLGEAGESDAETEY
jgi:hypothetical protein